MFYILSIFIVGVCWKYNLKSFVKGFFFFLLFYDEKMLRFKVMIRYSLSNNPVDIRAQNCQTKQNTESVQVI